MKFNVNKCRVSYGEYQSLINIHTDIHQLSNYSPGKKSWRLCIFFQENMNSVLGNSENSKFVPSIQGNEKKNQIDIFGIIPRYRHPRTSMSDSPDPPILKRTWKTQRRSREANKGNFSHRDRLYGLRLLSFKKDGQENSVLKVNEMMNFREEGIRNTCALFSQYKKWREL